MTRTLQTIEEQGITTKVDKEVFSLENGGDDLMEIRKLRAKNSFREEDEEVIWKDHFEVQIGEDGPWTVLETINGRVT